MEDRQYSESQIGNCAQFEVEEIHTCQGEEDRVTTEESRELMKWKVVKVKVRGKARVHVQSANYGQDRARQHDLQIR